MSSIEYFYFLELKPKNQHLYNDISIVVFQTILTPPYILKIPPLVHYLSKHQFQEA